MAAADGHMPSSPGPHRAEGLVLVRRAFGSSCLPGPGDRLGCSHQLALGVAFQPWDSCWV
jgi:hypothetical protein